MGIKENHAIKLQLDNSHQCLFIMYDIVKESNEDFFIQTPSNPIRTHSQENPTKINKIQSQFLGEYEQAFSSIKEKCQKYLPNFEGKEIHYDQDTYSPFCYKIEEQLNNFEIVILKVWLGSFTTHLKILNIDINSPLSAFQSTAEGNFGQIYSFRFAGQNIAIKSFCVSNSEKSLKKSLKKIILEFCIFKICDALRCGPHISNYFGFDILIFRDKIQFAMEKCQKCDFHDKYQEQLRENLGILHRYKIMHMDINWNNIMYSPTYRKNIFIDFGFSEVIAEECGFKTYTSFKGTPQYISNQMLTLFKEDSFGFVDLYYNDLTGLQVALKNIQCGRKKGNQSYDSLQGYQPEYEGLTFRQQIKGANDYIQYILVLLKHECYFNKSNIRTVLQIEDKILLQKHCKKVIQLLSKVLSTFFFDKSILAEFNELSKTVQYKEYLQQLGKKQIEISCGTTDYQKNQVFSYQKRFSQYLLNADQPSNDERRTQFIESAVKYLKQEPALSDQQQKLRYFAIFFDFVRFDKSNLDLPVKQQISNDFLTFTKEKTGLNSKDPLDSIKRAFQYLFHYCVCPPQTRWKQQRFFQLLLQCLFLELDFSEGLSAIQEKMAANCYDCKELIYILYEYCLINSIFEMKHKFQNFQLGKRLIFQIKEDSRAMALFIIENYGKSQVKQQKSAAQIIDWQLKLKDNPSRQYQSYELFLSDIKDQRLQMVLIKISLMIELQNSQKLSDFSLHTKTIEKTKQTLFFNVRLNLNSFRERLVWNCILSSQYRYQKSCQRYFQQIKITINCPNIYDSLVFKFKFWQQWAEKDADFFKTMYSQLIICCFQQKRLDIYSFLFSDMITLLQGHAHIREENMDLLAEIAQKYIDCLQQHLKIKFQITDNLNIIGESNRQQQQKYQQQFSLYLHLHTYQGFFYDFLLRCKQQMKEFTSLYGKIIKGSFWKTREMIAIFNQDSPQVQFASFYYYNMLRYQAFHEKNLQKIYKHEREILKITSPLIPQYMKKAIFLLMLDLKYYQNNQQKQQINNLVVWSWKYHEVNGYMKAYFIESRKRPEIIKQVLQILYLSTQKKDRVYQFLQSIINVLGQQPIRYYINIFISNISMFCNLYPQFFDYPTLKIKLQPLNWSNRYQILCFSHALLFSQRDEQIKELLILIAKNIRYVKWACQQIVLNHYFETMFKWRTFSQFKKRKNIFLIKFLATKILLKLCHYHQIKTNIFLNLIDLRKKQRNFFKKKLKEKIQKWNFKKYISR